MLKIVNHVYHKFHHHKHNKNVNKNVKCKDCKHYFIDKSGNKLCSLLSEYIPIEVARSDKLLCYDAWYFEPINYNDWVSIEEWW